MDEAVRAMGRRVLTRLVPPERVALQTRGVAPLPPAEREQVERGLREALGRQTTAKGGGATALLRVTVSAAMARRVMVAEFSRGEEAVIMMAEYDAPDAAPRPVRARPLLERTLLWEQDERILDAAVTPENGEFWVLDTERLTLRDRLGETRRQIRVRRDDVAWPRDVRGRIALGGGGEARAMLPGPGSTPWPLAPDFDAVPTGENEFSTAGVRDRFFTAARVSPSAVLLAGVDGKLRWSEAGVAREVEGLWGSEIAAVDNPCGAGGLVIASSRDGQSLGVFEAAARALRPAGEGMTLPGILSALWPAEGVASATAVVRTAAGRYAAYRVFAGCSR